MKAFGTQILHSALLVASVLLIGGACEYYRPFSQMISTYNLSFKPIYATWALIAGMVCLCIHQRETA